MLHRVFSEQYGRLGGLIAKYPIYFLLIPLAISITLSLGILNISYKRDLFTLFVPTNGRAMKDLKVMEELFERNISSDYDPSRLIKERMYLSIIISALDGKTILREEVFEEIRQVDNIVQNVTIEYVGKRLNYSQICSTNFGECIRNWGLLSNKQIRDFHQGIFTMKYPVEIDPISFKVIPYVQGFGGVTTDEDGYVKEVLAYRYFYAPYGGNYEMREVMLEWEKTAMRAVSIQQFNFIKLSMVASSDKELSSRQFTENVVHLSGISAAIILLFCIIVCMSSSLVRSKPWLGVSACVSTSLASVAAFGLVTMCGVSYIDINVSLPFLLLGMGIDDSFVLLSVWKSTGTQESVQRRLQKTYSRTAASITITSLTNFISFVVGLTAPFPVIRIFCLYAAAGVLFTLLYQLTFFGACMALTGQREAKGLNPFTCRKITVKSIYDDQPSSSSAMVEKVISMANVKTNIFGIFAERCLSHRPAKITVFILYCCGLAVGMWGFHAIKEGLSPKDVLPKTSTVAKYFDDHYRYYARYTHRIHVAITAPLNYADPQTDIKIERTLKKFEANRLIADASLTESWLRAFRMFANSDASRFTLGAYNISYKQDFIDGLRSFLRFPQTRSFNKDVIFNEDYTEIAASRFFLLCNEVKNKQEEKSLLETVWRTVDDSEIPITAYTYWFPFYEQLIYVKPTAVQTLCLATAAIMVVFFSFIPDVMCSIVVATTVLTIQIEVIGLMSMWNISMDMFSLLNLIMCVGFSINYPAHVAFSYMTAQVKTADGRMKAALHTVGFPIIQGSSSTVIGVLVLLLDRSYMFTVFFRTTFLVVVLTAFHSILFVPVALSVVDRFLCCNLNEAKRIAVPLSTEQQLKERVELPFGNSGRTEQLSATKLYRFD